MRACVCVLLLVLCAAALAAKDEKDCEVCIKVLTTVADKAGSDVTDQDKTEKILKNYCKAAKGKENRFCYYIGGLPESAVYIVKDVTGPLSRHLPPEVACQRLKKKDKQVCELRFDEEIDLSTMDLDKQRVKTLRKILNEKFNDGCKGCVEKADFIRRIRELSKTDL
eukprot:m.19999 g.19999  ORF g.19999 m.19999 type:complete len:167 (-) comp10466_c0_seq1:109-609(-)